MSIATLAALTIVETVRRRVVAIVGCVSLVLVAGAGWGFHLLSGAIGRPDAATAVEAVLTILLAFAFSVVLAAGGAFLAAPSIAADLENGIALAILPRPISRAEYVVAKWLGLVAIVSAYCALVGTLGFFAIGLGGGYHAPHQLEAIAFLGAQCLVLLTLALALSTRLAPIAAGIVALAAFGASWICGVTAVIASDLHADTLALCAKWVGLLIPSDGLWRGALYELTPVAMLVGENATGERGVNPFGVTAPPAPAFLLWAALWTVAALALAVASMRARDV
jgi:ABC-type transport system involved in multi-copper enzyme maturation permease subunit